MSSKDDDIITIKPKQVANHLKVKQSCSANVISIKNPPTTNSDVNPETNTKIQLETNKSKAKEILVVHQEKSMNQAQIQSNMSQPVEDDNAFANLNLFLFDLQDHFHDQPDGSMEVDRVQPPVQDPIRKRRDDEQIVVQYDNDDSMNDQHSMDGMLAPLNQNPKDSHNSNTGHKETNNQPNHEKQSTRDQKNAIYEQIYQIDDKTNNRGENGLDGKNGQESNDNNNAENAPNQNFDDHQDNQMNIDTDLQYQNQQQLQQQQHSSQVDDLNLYDEQLVQMALEQTQNILTQLDDITDASQRQIAQNQLIKEIGIDSESVKHLVDLQDPGVLTQLLFEYNYKDLCLRYQQQVQTHLQLEQQQQQQQQQQMQTNGVQQFGEQQQQQQQQFLLRQQTSEDLQADKLNHPSEDANAKSHQDDANRGDQDKNQFQQQQQQQNSMDDAINQHQQLIAVQNDQFLQQLAQLLRQGQISEEQFLKYTVTINQQQQLQPQLQLDQRLELMQQVQQQSEQAASAAHQQQTSQQPNAYQQMNHTLNAQQQLQLQQQQQSSPSPSLQQLHEKEQALLQMKHQLQDQQEVILNNENNNSSIHQQQPQEISQQQPRTVSSAGTVVQDENITKSGLMNTNTNNNNNASTKQPDAAANVMLSQNGNQIMQQQVLNNQLLTQQLQALFQFHQSLQPDTGGQQYDEYPLHQQNTATFGADLLTNSGKNNNPQNIALTQQQQQLEQSYQHQQQQQCELSLPNSFVRAEHHLAIAFYIKQEVEEAEQQVAQIKMQQLEHQSSSTVPMSMTTAQQQQQQAQTAAFMGNSQLQTQSIDRINARQQFG